MNNTEYPSMKISHNIVEHLGLKLYQNKPTNVIAELVSNSWDANANRLNINIINKSDKKYISIEDNGCGMNLEILKNTYLVIGKSKYNSLDEQKEIEHNTKRKPMGRKGIGKLAPFGICHQMHVITVRDNKINWLRFDYNEMIQKGKSSSIEEYKPKFIFFELELNLQQNLVIPSEYSSFTETIEKFISEIKKQSSTGTLIILSDLTLKKSIPQEQLIESIGQRFTIALGRPDFQINVNNISVTEDNALPRWELRIPESGVTTDTVNVNGQSKEIRYWIGFVEEAKWPTEHAGIGIYAHGKIAQDRPFFFNVEGREILSRYMYGVIEADLIEELDEDLISTDRTSINWENDAFQEFFKKGQEITKTALTQYLKHRQVLDKEKNEQRIKNLTTQNTEIKLSSKEKVYLGELLNEITPKLGKDEEKIKEFTTILAKSWLNEPSRRMVKKLWGNVKNDNIEQLYNTLDKLSDELVPQSLNLAKTFAQRVFALTKLKERIEDGKETPLQKLLEEFPWIISHTYEKFTQRESLNTFIKKAEEEGYLHKRALSLEQGRTMPDFIFLGSSNEDILVIELKDNNNVGFPEFEQLRSYVEFIENRYPTSNVKGYLIASSIDEITKKRIDDHSSLEFMSWDTLFKKSRKEYMAFLTALLLMTDENPQDTIDLGGKEVEEFLRDMAKNDEEIQELMERYNLSSKPSPKS
jgi:hypothetical protein